MKQKKQFYKLYGLRNKFILSIVFSAAICLVLFIILYFSVNAFLTEYFERSDFAYIQSQMQGDSLQTYINDNNISSKDLGQLRKWEYQQGAILLELYLEDECLYSSFYDVPTGVSSYATGVVNHNNVFEINLKDMAVTAVVYSDVTYKYYAFGMYMSFIVSLIVFMMIFLISNRKMIRYICRLNEEVQILEGGNLEYQVSVEGNDEITDLAKSMNRMRESFQKQMETEQELHQANKRLITEMSHDLRTPLTGIMLYLEILRSHRYKSEEELEYYFEKIDAKAHHMKLISDHLFEYAVMDKPRKQIEPAGMEHTFSEVIENFKEELETQNFSVECSLQWGNCYVQVNREYIHRIFSNIMSNILKYAEPTEAIRIDTVDSDKYCGFSILNVLPALQNQVESNGIGIESIRRMMEEMQGICTVEQTDTIFEITLLFAKR